MSTPLHLLRAEMARHHVVALLVPTADFHDSEYVGDHFSGRAWLSGFTGSAGTLLVLMNWAGLWTDSRYFLQAQKQLEGTGITLMRSGLQETPTLEAYLEQTMQAGQTLAFDGRCVSARQAESLRTRLEPFGVNLRQDLDLVGHVWADRPPRSAHPLWSLELPWSGVSRGDKLSLIRADMARLGTDLLLLSTLEDIAWLLNLRGGDLPYTPVFLSYLLLSETGCTLFVSPSAVSPDIRDALESDGLQLAPYDSVYEYLDALPPQAKLLTDRRRTSCRLLEALPSAVTVIDRPSPTEGRKVVKNPVEARHMQAAHVRDGVALTKFLCWLKTTAPLDHLTERSAAAHLETLRQAQEGYLGPSFSPIAAWGPNGAIVHYSATEESDTPLQRSGFLLVDSGGHYLGGTTDCTRTVALGSLSAEEKLHYTAVLRGHLALAAARFKSGCTGVNLDYLARAPLWALGLDYGHGTGHGVGYLLNVHEGPIAFRLRSTPQDVPLEAGMVISNEPGLYLEGRYGIRLENLLLCVRLEENPWGTFLGFESLTLAPFDLEAVESAQLTVQEARLLNAYHQRVRETLSPYLTPEEQAWLIQATRPVHPPVSSTATPG